MIAATLRTALLEAWANRRSFWVQVGVMVTNDAAWIAFWLLFFARVGSVRGWDAQRVLLMFAILTTSAGIALGLLANARSIGRLAADGELDAALSLPVEPLAYLLVRRVDTALLADLFFGVALFVFAGQPTPGRTALYVVGSLCAAAVLIGLLVTAGALTQFVGGRGEHADLGFQAILILASYPLEVFGGVTKVLMFTAIPAAFVTGVPTSLVDDFDPATALTLVAAAGFFVLLGAATFRLGLRHYSSGALWTRA
jgi:ABC-2 type transport system permease protein